MEEIDLGFLLDLKLFIFVLMMNYSFAALTCNRR